MRTRPSGSHPFYILNANPGSVLLHGMAYPRKTSTLPTVNRRAFLHATMGALAIPWAGSQVAMAHQSAGDLAVSSLPRCPVGFVDTQRYVTPAERLTVGDPHLLSNGIRLRCSGIRLPAGSLSEDLRSVTLDLAMKVPTLEDTIIPWKLWSYSNEGILNTSADIDAQAPLRRDGTLVFNLSSRWGADETRRYEVTLTTGNHRGVSKLRAGIYCIAIPGGGQWLSPRWHSSRWDTTRDGLYLRTSTQADLKPVAFPHIVLSVEDALSETNDSNRSGAIV